MDLIDCLITLMLFARFTISLPISENQFEISIIHINDFHARYEETSLDSGLCKSENCIGGFSRMYATIMRALDKNPNLILLNAGDNFEGTLWYNVHKWNVTQYFLNKLPTDAYTLGNHEFDDNLDGLIPFIESLNSPVVAANIDASQEPTMERLFNKSTIVYRNNRKIGVIGVVLSTITELVDIGNLILLDELYSVISEAERLVREENVFTNIILSHCGYNVEQDIARKSTANSKISVIVGGHSHSFLYSDEPIPGSDIPVGPYPTIVQNLDNEKVLVVQASAYTKYLGNISILYDLTGNVLSWSGAPIFLGSTLPKDRHIDEELEIWKKSVYLRGTELVGQTLVRLEQSSCTMSECLMGNFVTDAMVFWYTQWTPEDSWTNGSIALMHAGGIRSGIDIGNITYNDVISSQPFKNTIDIAEIRGCHLKEIFEESTTSTSINLLQVSGLKIVYNLKNPKGSRVTSIRIRCRNCIIPVYEKLKNNNIYRVILPSFLSSGGFGFKGFEKYLINKVIGPLDTDVYIKYIENRSPVFQEIEGRIEILF